MDAKPLEFALSLGGGGVVALVNCLFEANKPPYRPINYLVSDRSSHRGISRKENGRWPFVLLL
jgi:hypothetical protein